MLLGFFAYISVVLLVGESVLLLPVASFFLQLNRLVVRERSAMCYCDMRFIRYSIPSMHYCTPLYGRDYIYLNAN